MVMRPNVAVAKPASASSSGLIPHRRHAGVRKNAKGIAAIIAIAYARNQRDPGTFTPSGASNSTRHAGHLGISAKISDEHDDDSVAETTGIAEERGTISPILRRAAPFCTNVFALRCFLMDLGYCPIIPHLLSSNDRSRL